MTARLVVLRCAVLIAGVGSFACPDDPPDPTPDAGPACCVGSTTKVVRNACLPGEVRQPVSRCDITMPDTGVQPDPCGDGTFDQATEQCDSSAANGQNCPLGKTCGSMCTCVSACGNGMIEPGRGEDCERNPDCTAAMNLACRRCVCTARGAPVIFEDEINDLSATTSGFPYLDFDFIEMTLDGGPTERFDVKLAENIRPPPSDMKVCMAIQDTGAEIGRLCYFQPMMGQVDITWTTPGAGMRSIYNMGATIGAIGSGLRLEVDVATVGVPFRKELDFYWFTDLGGTLADRVPDTGVLSMTEFFGTD